MRNQRGFVLMSATIHHHHVHRLGAIHCYTMRGMMRTKLTDIAIQATCYAFFGLLVYGVFTTGF